ncbi:hypothetical protein [Mucilaginibacter ginsenosidivorax]|uniref:Uncharacterized protein n=1 Tax=Mucilaginibacter ginsenosidivorax TaxID=862126 RepID=A0A5B8VW74_9SPHI|nr:hypothetical protein [Mucilaginibacter ginsenosidivorax]QEC75770.1 hypothetical protein FSB76_07315 [Mucilaginibacter ginsenosidivorax]
MKLISLLLLSILLQASASARNTARGNHSVHPDSVGLYQYRHTRVLNSFCKVLTQLKKRFAPSYDFKDPFTQFGVKGKKPLAFFVYDLVDTLNNSTKRVVSFKEGHIYHFAPLYQYESFSNICILFHGKLVFFKAINCKKGINSINEVIAYLKQNLKNSPGFDGILSRTANYRHFGRYFKVDSSACFCEY